MAAYDLLDYQKQIVREIAAVVRDTGEAKFYYTGSSDGFGIFFNCTPRRGVELKGSDDLVILESQGLVALRYGSDGRLQGGTARQRALDAVAADFQVPAPSAAGTVQHFYAPVGAVTSGPGTISIATQNVGVSGEEVLQLIVAMRGAVGEVDVERRAEAAELINELEGELRSQVPKQSRIKSFVLGLWSAAGNVASFAASLTSIAQAYGIDAETLKRLTPSV